MTVGRSAALIALLLAGASGRCFALPDFGTQETVESVTLLRDREDASRFYAVPGGIVLRTLPDGGPDLAFTVARYSGSRVREDSGTVDVLSILRTGIVLDEPSAAALQSAETALELRERRSISIERLLPASVSARLIYASAGTPEDIVADRAYDEAQGETTVWRERSIVLGFSTATAELLDRILTSQSAGLSIAWSMQAEGWGPEQITGGTSLVTTGDTAPVTLSAEDLGEAVSDAIESEVPPQKPERIVFAAGAIPLRIAEELQPSRLIRYDIDAALPPSYPSLAVYCFTFKDALREDLWQRITEIEATGLTGAKTRAEASFSADAPRDYAETIRFRYAVDLRQPYRWRVRDTLASGEEQTSEWAVSDAWTAVIDVTNALAPDEGEVRADIPAETDEEESPQ